MWGERSFAMRVRGARYIRGLMAFHQAMKEGHVMFGGRFFEAGTNVLSGVILVDKRHLRAEHLQAQRQAQARYEKGLRLAAQGREDYLNQHLPRIVGFDRYWAEFGIVSAVWVDAADESKGVRYRVNGSSAELGKGLTRETYSFDELIAFANRVSQKAVA